MKDNRFYFQHDNTSFSDEKVLDLRSNLGIEGYGIYWALIELLHQNGGKMQMLSKRLAFALQVDDKKILSVINDYNLFEIDDGFFYSKRLLEQIQYRAEIVEKRRVAGKSSASVQQMLNKKTHKGKERKGKESITKQIKEKEIKENIPDDWKIVFDKWLKYKTEIREKYKSEQSIVAALSRLKELSNNNLDIADKIVEQSIANGWKGLFELKEKNKKPIDTRYMPDWNEKEQQQKF
jgi:hypothetical protein